MPRNLATIFWHCALLVLTACDSPQSLTASADTTDDDFYESSADEFGPDELDFGEGSLNEEVSAEPLEVSADNHAEAIDPIGGTDRLAPARCGSSPIPAWADAPTPSSLGNGLVSDSQVNLRVPADRVHIPKGKQEMTFAWSTFADNAYAMARNGFRPAQLRAAVSVENPDSKSPRLALRDRSIYIADDDSNFRTEIETYVFSSNERERAKSSYGPSQRGARPTSIDSFAPRSALMGYTIAWVYDGNSTPWRIRVGRTVDEFEQILAEFSDDGFRPISISSRRRGDRLEYAGIFVRDAATPDQWEVELGVRPPGLNRALARGWDRELYPFRISAEHSKRGRVDILWMRRPVGLHVEIRTNLSRSAFEREDARQRARGYHLETVEQYGAEDRHVAVWVQYENCLRWTSKALQSQSSSTSDWYAMFHEQGDSRNDLLWE